jgi:hypothetical protein
MATADLNSTISALKGGLTALPAEAAVANIDSWHSQLKDAAPEVAATLAELKTALTSGSASGSSIGALLTKLGGREIWGLPKELAQFTWTEHSVTVSQADKFLCTLNYRRQSFGLPLKLSASPLM